MTVVVALTLVALVVMLAADVYRLHARLERERQVGPLAEAARRWYRCRACGDPIPLGWAHQRHHGAGGCQLVHKAHR